jgi:hypothetical protein
VSAGRGPSYEELAALVVRQAERIEQLEAEVAELKRRRSVVVQLARAPVDGGPR